MTKEYSPDRTIFIDMDGVMAGFDTEVIKHLQVSYPEFIADRTRDQFYISDTYPEYAQQIRSIYSQEGFFLSLPLIDGVLEGWQRLLDAGWQPRVLSAPLRSNITCEQEKRQWLVREINPHFGPEISRDAIIINEKYLHNGVALIDDRGVIEGVDEATWSHVVIDYPHNKSTETDLRLYGMADPRLEEVMVMAHDRYIRSLGARAL